MRIFQAISFVKPEGHPIVFNLLKLLDLAGVLRRDALTFSMN